MFLPPQVHSRFVYEQKHTFETVWKRQEEKVQFRIFRVRLVATALPNIAGNASSTSSDKHFE